MRHRKMNVILGSAEVCTGNVLDIFITAKSYRSIEIVARV